MLRRRTYNESSGVAVSGRVRSRSSWFANRSINVSYLIACRRLWPWSTLELCRVCLLLTASRSIPKYLKNLRLKLRDRVSTEIVVL